MCPFYPGLTPGTWCPHCLAAPLPCHIIPLCSFCTLICVLMHCAHSFLQMVLTPSCGSFYVVWNTASCPGPRQSDSQSPHRTIWINTLLLSAQRLALQQKAAAEWTMEGGVAFPPCLFKIKHHCPGEHIKDLVWRSHLYKSNTLYITPLHYGPSRNVTLREDGSSREPWTVGTLVFPKQCYQGLRFGFSPKIQVV